MQIYCCFDYFDKALIVLPAKNGRISIISFASAVGVLVGIASASFRIVFSWTTGIIKKLLRITRNTKKKYNKIVMLATSKLISIETPISQALIDLEISHEEFETIINKKEKYEKKYEKMKEDIRTVKSSDKLNKKSRENMSENIGNA